MNRTVLLVLLAVFSTSASTSAEAQKLCTYRTYSWNTVTKEAVNPAYVKKPYSDLTDEEVDKLTGCSVCEEDQRVIDVPPLKSFKVCHILARQLAGAVNRLILEGEPVYSITGYRVGKTRGEIDASGNRTRFSNHSFGIAIDLNPDQNGLYDHCIQFSKSCRLIRGGHWDIENEGSLTANGAIVGAMKNLGLKWGGQILGRQKDFMHFSPSGY